MELIIPVGKLILNHRELTNVKLSISNRYLLIIGMGPDNSYEEHLLEITSDTSREILKGIVDYVDEALDELDELLINLSQIFSINLRLEYTVGQDAVNHVLDRLRIHEEGLNTIGNGWRKVLDSVRIGKVNYQLRGRSPMYVLYSGNNITLNLVSEPINDPVMEFITYTEGKATGVVRVRVGEDVVVKVDLRSASAFVVLAQVEDYDGLNSDLVSVLSNTYPIIIKHVNNILSIMRRRGVIV